MKILCVFGQHNYGNPNRGLGYEYANFIPAFRNLGHEVVFFESLSKATYSDYIDLNRMFLKTVSTEKPDVIFCVLMGYEIWLETFELIREGSNAVLIHWATDDSWKYKQFSRFIAPVFDVYATTYSSAMARAAKEGHKNFVLTQWAANSAEMRKPIPVSECQHSVSFVGTNYGNRGEWINKLGKRGIKVECFGYGWSNGPISAEEIPVVMRESIISLNYGDSGVIINNGKPVRSRQIKARVFEVPGAGGLLATENAEHLSEFYLDGEEIVVFDDIDDLVEKINHIIKHPGKRDQIAMAGYTRTKQEHTYEARFRPILEKAIVRRKLRAITKNEINFDQFDNLAALHQPNTLLLLLKRLLSLIGMLVWGRKRGKRAARRILFEVSWRIFGRKTYSVTGWPGRLFYKES